MKKTEKEKVAVYRILLYNINSGFLLRSFEKGVFVLIPINLATIKNIRDLGGTEVAHGLFIRPGCLIRSAHLGYASQEDVRYLQAEHDLSKIIDLRDSQERYELPDHPFGTPVLRQPILESLQSGITHEEGAEEKTDGIPDMAGLYRNMMTDPGCTANFRKVLSAIFEHDYRSGSILWHCTEGKDRCGMTTVLVLTALGADQELIMDDYLETNRTNLPKARAIYEKLCPVRGEAFAESVYNAYIADERYLEAAWDVMGDNYLTDVLGFKERQLRKFRKAVLTNRYL